MMNKIRAVCLLALSFSVTADTFFYPQVEGYQIVSIAGEGIATVCIKVRSGDVAVSPGPPEYVNPYVRCDEYELEGLFNPLRLYWFQSTPILIDNAEWAFIEVGPEHWGPLPRIEFRGQDEN